MTRIKSNISVGGSLQVDDIVKVNVHTITPENAQDTLVIDLERMQYINVDLINRAGNTLIIEFDNVSTGVEYFVFFQQPPTHTIVSMSDAGQTYEFNPDPATNGFLTALNVDDAVVLMRFTYDELNPDPLREGTIRMITASGGVGGSYVENQDYLAAALGLGSSGLTTLVNGEAYTVALARLDGIVSALRPPLPPQLGDNIALEAHVLLAVGTANNSAIHAGTGSLVSNIITTNTDITLETLQGDVNLADADFYDPESGELKLYLEQTSPPTVEYDNVVLGAGDNTGTGVNGHIDIQNTTQYDNFSRTMNVGLTVAIADIPESPNPYFAKLSLEGSVNDSETNERSFYIMTPVALLAPLPTHIANGAVYTRISGIPCLVSGDTCEIQTTWRNTVTNFYSDNGVVGVYGLGGLSDVVETEISLSGIQTPFADPVINTDVPVKGGIFTDDFTVYVASFFPTGGSSSLQNSKPTLPRVVDSITNRALYAFDHDTALTLRPNDLMLLGGLFQYPNGDYSGHDDGTGTVNGAAYDYSTLTGARFMDFTVTDINNLSGIIVSFGDSTGLNSVIVSNNNWLMELTFDHPDYGTITIDCNSAYAGVGDVTNGDGALVVANSTATEKYITFGKITNMTNATLRIGFDSVGISFNQFLNIQSV